MNLNNKARRHAWKIAKRTYIGLGITLFIWWALITLSNFIAFHFDWHPSYSVSEDIGTIFVMTPSICLMIFIYVSLYLWISFSSSKDK